MRSATNLIGILVLTSIATAQTSQMLGLWPGAATPASRGTLGKNAGELFQAFPASMFRGIGEFGGKCAIHGMFGVVYDPNSNTSETFDWIVRHGTDSGGPSRSASDLVGKVLGIKTPTRSGAWFWHVTTTFVAPMSISDCTKHISAGVVLPAANYPTDGLGVHTASQSNQYSHSRQEDHAWQFTGTSTVAQHPHNRVTFRIGLLLPSVVMQLGNGSDHYGMGGMFPATGQPLTARLRGGTGMANAAGFVVLSSKPYRLTGVPLGRGARVYLSPSYHFFGVKADANGEATLTLLTQTPAAYAGLGTFHLQSVYDKNGVLYFSNSASVTP